jgi:hypothetical protein
MDEMVIEQDDMTVKLTRTSGLTGRKHTRIIPLDEMRFDLGIIAWFEGALIQDAFPTLSPDDREFIATGITPDEWNAVLGIGTDDLN